MMRRNIKINSDKRMRRNAVTHGLAIITYFFRANEKLALSDKSVV